MVDPQSQPTPQTHADEDPLAGTPYRLLRYVTEGAMGEIAEAEHVALRREVIVKLIRRADAARPGFVDRLRLEAQALAALAPRTPHIVAVQDFGETRDGRPFLVLERLSGRTLQEEIRARRVLPLVEAVGLARQLLAALACAHEGGVVHRDVKPANIFLATSEREGRVLKLLDFGIAKVLPGDASEEERVSLPAAPTEEGMPLGTPRYFSPEQARGTSADHRSDLYSAGAVLYAMLTGRDPFAHHEEVAAVIRAQVHEAPRPPSLVGAQPIPEALDRVILKALSKRPQDRFASAAEMSAALDQSLVPKPFVAWAKTERIDVTVFQGAVRRGSAPLPDTTEPLDVSVFRGAGRAHPFPAAPSARVLASPVVPRLPLKIMDMAPPATSAAPDTMRRPRRGPGKIATAVLLVAVFVAVSFVVVLLFLGRRA